MENKTVPSHMCMEAAILSVLVTCSWICRAPPPPIPGPYSTFLKKKKICKVFSTDQCLKYC